MYQVMIADDDFLVRSYLKTLHAWEQAGFEIAADVRDGEEALGALKVQPVDVVVTDISMPLMDGIELIRRIREENQQIYIIVLSCHDDFDYVKEAMRLGANEYVLKNTLNEETLRELLKNSSIRIGRMKEEETRQEYEKKLIKMGSQALKYHFFNQLISGTMPAEEKEKKRLEAGIRGKFLNSAVVCMFLKNWNSAREAQSRLEEEQYSQQLLQLMAEKLEQVLEIREETEVIYLGAGIFCCFLSLPSGSRSSVMRQKLTSAASLCVTCAKEQPYPFGISVSSICMGQEGIRQAYQQVREMMKQSFYEGEEILYYDNYKPLGQELPKTARDLLDKAQACLPNPDENQFAEQIKKSLAEFRKQNTDSRLVLQWQKSLDKKLQIDRGSEFYQNVSHISALEELAEHGYDAVKIKKEMPKGVGNAVRIAAEYIQEHYRKPIGLADAAEAAGVNSAYLSYLFKQEMGIGFSNYLLECRLEDARKLLRTTNLKIKDVSAQAGFNDYHYFSKTFKKMTGVSPADYRKQEP